MDGWIHIFLNRQINAVITVVPAGGADITINTINQNSEEEEPQHG